MLPLSICLLAFITSQSLIPQSLGQDELAFGSRRVPRNSDLTNQVSQSPRNLLSLQGHHQELDDLSFDLMPQAQSYFIEPDLPTTTSVRPMFKRRKTLRPISTAEVERKKQQLADAEAANDNPGELPNKIPFKPLRQIHHTGFAKQRPSAGQRPRSRAQTVNTNQQNDNANNNNYELNEIPTTTEGQFEPTPSKEVDNVNINSGRSFQSGRRKKIEPTFSPQIKIGRPNRFQPRRKLQTSAVPPSENPVTEASQQQSTQSARNLRNGRPGFVLRPKPQTVAAPGEAGPPRRRKKPTTEASTTDDQSVQNTFEHGQVSEGPIGRKVPSDTNPTAEGTQFQPRRTNNFQRRPNLKSTHSQPSESDVPFNNEGFGQSHAGEKLSVSMRMRRRPGSARAFNTPTDSVHESSDAVAVIAVKNPEESTPTQTEPESPSETYRPRNLSQRPNPLDKLSNRQAAARRFLTPKKSNEQASTAAPAFIISSKPGRRSPLSLQNLRNRRLGKPDVTSTEVPPAEASVPVDTTNSTAVNGTDTGKELPQPEFDSEDNKNDTVVVSAPVEGTNVSDAPKVEELPIPKRPLLPGQRKPLPGRIPLLSKPKVVTTTAKPIHEDTTPAPTCEDGKRYNKVLRKCIPPFALRSG